MQKKSLIFIWIILAIFSDSIVVKASEDPEIVALQKTSKAFSRVAKSSVPAVVYIKVEKKMTSGWNRNQERYITPFDLFNEEFFDRFFKHRYQKQPSETYVEIGQGSGFIISKEGHILTNHHVVGEGDRINVILSDGRTLNAQFIGSDPKSDVAVIKIDGENLPVLSLGNSDQLDVGEWVIAIGNPFGLSHTITVGVVSAKGRSSVGINDYEDFIQTDAAINPGNSGGPLINLQGEVVGINTAIFSKSGGYMGIGFAIPINMAKVIETQLVKTGSVARGYLGVSIQDITAEQATKFGIKTNTGALIAEVFEGSPAAEADLKPGDVVLKFADKPIESGTQLRNIVALTEPGTTVEMQILRDGNEKSKKVNIRELSETYQPTSRQIELMNQLGFAVQDLTEALAQRLGYQTEGGIIVSEILRGSTAHQAGLRPGMVILEINRKPVHTTREFLSILTEAVNGPSILLRVQDGHYTQYLVLQ